MFRREDPTNRGYRSPGGHLIEYDDNPDSQGLRHTSITGFKVNLDDKNKKLVLETPGGVIVTLDDNGKAFQVVAENKVEFTTKEEIHTVEKYTVAASDKVDIKGEAGTDLGSEASTTMVKGQTVLLAGGGVPVAVVGGKAIGTGNGGAPVISTIIQGSSKVFAAP